MTKNKENEGKILLELARSTLENFLSNENIHDLSKLKTLENQKPKGVFVTLNKKNGDLRGCMGIIPPIYDHEALDSLYNNTIRSAINSGVKDPRFRPISLKELDNLNIEVTVLSMPEQIKEKTFNDVLNNIELGKDGLFIKEKNSYKQAVFLPQVPTEQRWDKNTYYEELCEKANINQNVCKDVNKMKIFKFKGEIFSEKK